MTNLPTLTQALDAIGSLTGNSATIKSAESLVHIVTGLFTHPTDQAALKTKFAEVEASALSALDRLDAAIDVAETG
ncbi:hypothetical protein U1839_06005 [Sphingomonas sp. RT2P30]|uniref:hypothetical protein n=1 Tax=Parasphingomonas halimpatiens TaxID=3096162 RepID=UPI002FC7E086